MADFPETIELRREGMKAVTNVPRIVVHHSPDGFEYGYGGSGPSDLALNILEGVIREHFPDFVPTVRCWDGNMVTATAWGLYQQFKIDFIAPANRRFDYSIKSSLVVQWIIQNSWRLEERD